METFLGVLGTLAVVSLIVALFEWGTIRELNKGNKRLASLVDDLTCRLDTAHHNGGVTMRERDAIQAEYDALLEKLRQQALTPTPPQPQNRRIRAGSYADIRKANEAANRESAELEEARERDTAFVEN